MSGFSYVNWAGSTTGYCIFIRGNLVSWRGKKQNVVSRSSVESEYGAMSDLTRELVWVKDLASELGFTLESTMRLYCDNKTSIHNVENHVFHKRTKHILR